MTPEMLRNNYATTAIKDKKIIFGHYSFTFYKNLDQNRKVACLFREPVGRLLSMANHFRTHVPRYRSMTIADILQDARFAGFSNYQTKVMSMPDGDRHINEMMMAVRPDLDAALENFYGLDFVGTSERYRASIRAFRKASGLELRPAREKNKARRYTPTKQEIDMAVMMNDLDSVLHKNVKDFVDKS